MASNPHVLAISLPLQGHINPLIQLCNRLVSKGIRVTYVTTASLSKTLEREADSNLISIEAVPDSVADEEEAGFDIFEAFFRNFRAAMTGGLPEVIARYSNSGEPPTAIVYDSCIPWMLEFAHEKGLKGAVLFTQPATVCAVFYHVHKGSLGISPHDEDDVSEVSLPGLPVMGVKDLPSLLYDVKGFYQAILRTLVEQFSTFEMADWRLFNTFDKLEDKVLKWMGNEFKIRTIGPTVPSMYTDKRLDGNYDYGLSLFKPQIDSCKKWLDLKDDGSVVYVSFGSMAELSEKQMEEVAHGLIESRCNFIWVVRETEQSKLPQYLASGLIEEGLIVKWCSQLEVLSHRAVGCFFSHCGWNSTLEALVLGVPMVVMPQWADQTTNAKLIADVWRTGVRVKVDGNGIVMREEIVARLHEVMEREGGDEIRRNVLKWKDLAIEAVSEGGSSDQNIAEFASELLSTFGNIHEQKIASALLIQKS